MSSLPSAASSVSARAVAPGPVRVLTGWRRGLMVVAGGLMRLWCASLRFDASPETRRLALDPRATLFVLWHNRLFVAAEISRRLRAARPLHCLVSASKDGAWLSAFFESAGLRVVRGSSSRGGREAVSALLDVLRAGQDAGITPDGPRGPMYGFKPGALVVARRSRARVILIGIHPESVWRLPSWDRFILPRLFSRVWIVVREVPPDVLEDENARGQLEEQLCALNAEPGAETSTAQAGSPVL